MTESRPGDGPTVVVVDDNRDLILVVTKLLERHRFTVVGTAADGQGGIDLATGAQPDALLLDLAMPTVDGETALPQILVQAPHTMVAILSAYLDPSRARRLLMSGAFAAYDKGNLGGLPSRLGEDLVTFKQALDGMTAVPAWQRRYHRL